MDAQTTSPNLPPPSPTESGTSPTHSIANVSVTSTKKRRVSASGSRGVANLTPEQLAKKRANDREAQRAIRERTKGQIEALERRIQDLTSQQPYQDLQHVIRQKEIVEAENEEIKRKLNQVLNIIQPLLGGNGNSVIQDLAYSQRETQGLRLDCNARANGTLHSSVTSMPALAPHRSIPDTPSLRTTTSSTSTYGASPQAMQPTPPMQHQPSFAAPTTVPTYAVDRQRNPIVQNLASPIPNEKLDVGFILDGQQAHNGRQHTPLTPNYSHQAATPIQTPHPLVNSQTSTTLPSSICAYNNPLRHITPTCPLDGLLLDFLHKRRQLAAEGLPPRELVGPAYPNFTSIQYPERSHHDHPLSKVYTDIVRTFPDIKELPEQIAVSYIMFLTMRWQICPTQENYDRLPEWVRPLPSQHIKPHPAWIDNIPWPRMREQAVCHYPEVSFNDFFVPYTITISLNWPYDPKEALIKGSPGEDAEVGINPLFERHMWDLGNWSLGPSFAKKFPMLAETCRIKGDEKMEREDMRAMGC